MLFTLKRPQAQFAQTRESVFINPPKPALRPAQRYLALQCIALQCIPVISLRLLCITALCIFLLCITLQCITHQRIPDLLGEDPNFFANVRTRPLTDFIDFLALKVYLCFGFVYALTCYYE